METIEDIIREKRTTSREIRSRTRDQFGRELADMLDKEADRLEAAEKNSTMLCHQVCSCEILAKLETEDEKLRALVKELADIVDAPLCHQDCAKCPPDTRCASKRLRALVAKAREVVK